MKKLVIFSALLLVEAAFTTGIHSPERRPVGDRQQTKSAVSFQMMLDSGKTHEKRAGSGDTPEGTDIEAVWVDNGESGVLV